MRRHEGWQQRKWELGGGGHKRVAAPHTHKRLEHQSLPAAAGVYASRLNARLVKYVRRHESPSTTSRGDISWIQRNREKLDTFDDLRTLSAD